MCCIGATPAGDWRKALSSDGRTYYWNIHTRQTQWKQPTGYKDES